MKRFVLLTLMMLQSSALLAQFRIDGVVRDVAGVPVQSAAVILVDPASGAFIRHDATTADGTFSLTGNGNLQIYVSCLGYEQYESDIFTVNGDTELPAIILTQEDVIIDDVVVVGEKQSPSIKIENGKIVYSPNNSSTLAGSTALEVLKKTPGVFVDGENNISIGGQSSVLVILNGKQTYMQKDELVTLLKATPSSAVSSVEVMQSPSAKYDAEGSGGIININMDKNVAEGLFLSLNNGVSYWEHLRENTELSVSYAKERFSISVNYNHAFGYYGMDYGMRRIQAGKEYWSPTDDTEKRKTISGNLNIEYAIDKRQSIGGRININTLFGPGLTETTTEIRDAETGVLEQILYAKNDYYMQKGNRYGGNLYYTANPRDGENYTVDFNYAWFDGGSGNLQPNKYTTADGAVLQDKLYKSVNRRNIHIYALSYDQTHQLWSGELKSGAKFSSVSADNGLRFYDVVDEEEIVDSSQSNDFKYSEHILAAYLLYSHPIGSRIDLEAGLRGEYTFSNGVLRTIGQGGDESNKQHYFNLFPTLSVNYQVKEDHTLSLSLVRRIDRPAYQDLNPFEYLLDELSSWKGNPFLEPQKTYQATVAYNHKRTAVSVAYSYMQNYKAQITDTVSVNRVIMTPRNIGSQQRVSLTIYQGLNIARWWEMNLNATLYYVKKDIAFDRYRKFDMGGFAGIFSIQNSIRLPWEIGLEVNGSFITKRLGASNEYVEPTGTVDIGVSKSFANKKWTISLAMTDIFWTSRWDNYSSFDGFQLWNWGKSETRQVKFNISYRFGKQRDNSHISNFNEIDRL